MRGERGVSLILFVFILAITATSVVAAYGFLVSQEMVTSGITLNDESALYIAKTGLERAMEHLEDDTNWSDNNGTSVINENFGAGSYAVDLSGGTRTTITVTSEAKVDAGGREVKRKLRQKIRRLPEAFNYALFWEGTGSARVDSGSVIINGGDVLTKKTLSSIGGGAITVSDGGTPAVTNGGFVYTATNWTAGGTYTQGTYPAHPPDLPDLDTTFYDDEITTAIAQPAGNVTYTGGTLALNGNTYIDGTLTIDGTTITGKGELAASGVVTVTGAASITPTISENIFIISRRAITIGGTTTSAAGTIIYSRASVTVNGVTLRGSFISADIVALTNSAAITGYIRSNILTMQDNATVNGSVVTNRFTQNNISASGKTVTINYDHSYLEEAAPGLGLDIDGDANEEGVITVVPGSWQQL